MEASSSYKIQVHQNQIQSRGYPSHNRSGYHQAKPLQPAPYALRTISADTIFPGFIFNDQNICVTGGNLLALEPKASGTENRIY